MTNYEPFDQLWPTMTHYDLNCSDYEPLWATMAHNDPKFGNRNANGNIDPN